MPVKCEICGQQIQNKSALQMHLRYKHIELTQETNTTPEKNNWLNW